MESTLSISNAALNIEEMWGCKEAEFIARLEKNIFPAFC